MSKNKNMQQGGSAFYAIGGIGALVYFLQNAHTAVEIVLALLKTIVWPALFVYKLLGFLAV